VRARTTARRRRGEDDARRKAVRVRTTLVSRVVSRRAPTTDNVHERARRLGARAAHEVDGARQQRAELETMMMMMMMMMTMMMTMMTTRTMVAMTMVTMIQRAELGDGSRGRACAEGRR